VATVEPGAENVLTSEQHAELGQWYAAEQEQELRDALARRAERWWEAGIGLLVGAGLLNAAGFSLNVLYARDYKDSCRTECDMGYLGDFAVPAAGLNLIALGFAAGGGALLRRHDEWNAGEAGIPRLRAANIAITGAALLGAGLFGEAISWSVALDGIPPAPCNAEGEYECTDRTIIGIAIGFQLSAYAASAGAGMLAYGVTPRPKRRARRKRSFQVAPMLGHNLGLSFAGRF
jgi:hypothetical protein